jgi:ATP-dependent Zn protease
MLPKMPQRFFSFKTFILIAAASIFAVYIFSSFQDYGPYDYTTFLSDLEKGKISSLTINGHYVQDIKYTDGTVSAICLPAQDNMIMPKLLKSKAQINIAQPRNDFVLYILFNVFPHFLFIALIIYINLIRSPMSMFNKDEESQTNNTKVTFKDVAGLSVAKRELMKIVQLTKHAQYFMQFGAKVPRGVLLYGPPGNGKTLLARALAHEAQVSFLYISGSQFVEVFVGLGASRVREIFAKARAQTPCIIFIDEIDAIGRQRSKSPHAPGGSDERENTLNQILVEMDGFNQKDGILVLAATNRADILDAALTRPGRFDVKIDIPLPFSQERLEAFKIYLDKCRVDPHGLSLKQAVQDTAQLPSATIAAIVNKAAVDAALEALECNTETIRNIIENQDQSDEEKDKRIMEILNKVHILQKNNDPSKYRDDLKQAASRGNKTYSDEDADDDIEDIYNDEDVDTDKDVEEHDSAESISRENMVTETKPSQSQLSEDSNNDDGLHNKESNTEHDAEIQKNAADEDSVASDDNKDQSKTQSQQSSSEGASSGSADGEDVNSKIKSAEMKIGYIQKKHLDNAIREMLIGAESGLKMSMEDRERTAYHEAGHAIVAYHFASSIIKEITIVPTGNALGMVISLPKAEDAVSYSRQWYEHRIAIGLGGIKAEEKRYGRDHVSSGATSDIKTVTAIARAMVMEFCMHDDQELGYLNYFSGDFYDMRGFDVKNSCDKAMHNLVTRIAKQVDDIFDTYYDAWIRLSKLLLELEKITGDEMDVIMKNPTLSLEELKNQFSDGVPEVSSEAKYIYKPSLTA